tara:strand:+ start:681 stop:1025 length:345 start_codon:yes stop_codon:yes gene_type:complete
MATTYTYHVCQLHTKSTPETNTVEYVDAYLHGEDENGKNTTQQFTFQPPIPESYSGDFIKYEDLTEAKIISWITTIIPEERRNDIQNLVDKKIAEFYSNPGISTDTTLKSPVPW